MRRSPEKLNGLSNHPLYAVWCGILTRCYNTKVKEYKYYGGRGISVCDEWRVSFLAFYRWAIDNGWRKGLQIDRENSNNNYSPICCRVTTSKINNRNRRNPVYITYKGDKKRLYEWAEIYQIKYIILHNRIFNYKWSLEDAFTRPINFRGNGYNKNKIEKKISQFK